ncbi:MAG: hypothetical protein BGN84_02940 [Afipia sp. 62-7]|nr:MAG: hypothetical protein BGN84_02940 [Afipia sp. 62-7]
MPSSISVPNLTKDLRRDKRRVTAKIVKLIRDQDTICLGIMVGVRHVLLAARLTMDAIFL